MVWTGLVRPIAGYLLFAPCGPVWSKLSASEITLPLRTRRAAATMSSGCVKLSVPISSLGPHLPQFLYFSAASRRSWRVSLRAVMAFHPKAKRLAVQAIAAALVLAAAAYLVFNTLANLEARRIAGGFAFLWREAGFEIGEASGFAYGAADSYAKALAVGLANTFKVALLGIVAATILGTVVGLSRLSDDQLWKRLGGAYVELVRNVPLLVQLFFWYALITEALPPPREALSPLPGVFLTNRGLFFPTLAGVPELQGFNFAGGGALSPEFAALLIGLSAYTAAFVAEIVRAGVLSVPRGQWHAAQALGLERGDV